MTQAVSVGRQESVVVQGDGRVEHPDLDNDEHWSWYWWCNQCGVESRRSSRPRAEGWADSHRCAQKSL